LKGIWRHMSRKRKRALAHEVGKERGEPLLGRNPDGLHTRGRNSDLTEKRVGKGYGRGPSIQKRKK